MVIATPPAKCPSSIPVHPENPKQLMENLGSPGDVEVVIRRADEAEMDEMRSYVQRKKEPRWRWHAIDHRSGQIWYMSLDDARMRYF
jgi:hypothetical protein